MKHEGLTKIIIGIFYDVYNALGYGFLEKVYENAMIMEFKERGIMVKNQFPIKVFYKGKIVGDYIGDLIVDNKVIIEIKSVNGLAIAHNNQLINYLTATDKEIGLLLNFGEKPEIKRMIQDNNLKKYNQYQKKELDTDSHSFSTDQKKITP